VRRTIFARLDRPYFHEPPGHHLLPRGPWARHAASMRPPVAHCHLGLGKLYRRTGQRQEAQEHLTTATTMYCEMDMRFWREKGEAEMLELA
jgi:hypothetical protein